MKRLLPVTIALLLGGCLTAAPPSDPYAGMRDTDGSVVWQNEYRFTPPPSPWQLLQLDEDDYSIGFYRACRDASPATYPCESTFAYAEEPFGYSRDLRERQEEFFRRFLWAARTEFDPPELTPIRALGQEALQADTVGHERVLGHKVLVRAVFARRGERVVGFYFTQWRPADKPFDRDQLATFGDFLDRFEFVAPSFYQRLTDAGTNDGAK